MFSVVSTWDTSTLVSRLGLDLCVPLSQPAFFCAGFACHRFSHPSFESWVRPGRPRWLSALASRRSPSPPRLLCSRYAVLPLAAVHQVSAPRLRLDPAAGCQVVGSWPCRQPGQAPVRLVFSQVQPLVLRVSHSTLLSKVDGAPLPGAPQIVVTRSGIWLRQPRGGGLPAYHRCVVVPGTPCPGSPPPYASSDPGRRARCAARELHSRLTWVRIT